MEVSSSKSERTASSGDYELSNYIITEEDATNLSHMIGSHWEMVGVGLGLSIRTIEQIKYDNPYKCRLAIRNMLVKWMEMPGGGVASNLVESCREYYACDYELVQYLRSKAMKK